MSVLLSQMLKAPGGQKWRRSCTVSDGSEFVRIDISREIIAPENSLRILCRRVWDGTKICRHFYDQQWWHKRKNGSTSKLRSNLVERSVPRNASFNDTPELLRQDASNTNFRCLLDCFKDASNEEDKTILVFPQWVTLAVAHAPQRWIFVKKRCVLSFKRRIAFETPFNAFQSLESCHANR